MQEYKSLYAAVTICFTLVNTQTDTHRNSVLINLHEKLRQLS